MPPPLRKKKSKVAVAVWYVIGGFVGLCVLGAVLSSRSPVQAPPDPNTEKALPGTIAKLKAKYPERRFAAFVGDKATIPFNSPMTLLRVDTVEVSRGSTGITAEISFTNTANEAIAPEVFLSAFDRSGQELVRAAVVSHKDKDLQPSASGKTPDYVAIHDANEVVIVAIDDDPAKRKKELAAKASFAAEERKAQAEVKARGPKPVPSEWDGVTPEVNEYLSDNLKDYDSLKIVNCSPVDTFSSNAWVQRVKYRARNSFGGYVLKEKLFVIREGKVIYTKDWRG